jgi:hypothetical protein
MFWALLAHPQEVPHKQRLVYCMRVMSVGCTRIGVELHYTPILVQPTDSAAPPEDEQVMLETCRDPWFLINLIKSASCWFYYTDVGTCLPCYTTSHLKHFNLRMLANIACDLHLHYIVWCTFISTLLFIWLFILSLSYILWKRGAQWFSCWGTALQTGRMRDRWLMVSLEFFIDIILLAALWPWGRLSL